jgi:hypothetical protein
MVEGALPGDAGVESPLTTRLAPRGPPPRAGEDF